MENLVLHAHFDGRQIQLDDPVVLQPNTKLLVTVLPSDPLDNFAYSEYGEGDLKVWLALSVRSLNTAYSNDEPEYSLTLISDERHRRLLTKLSNYLIG